MLCLLSSHSALSATTVLYFAVNSRLIESLYLRRGDPSDSVELSSSGSSSRSNKPLHKSFGLLHPPCQYPSSASPTSKLASAIRIPQFTSTHHRRYGWSLEGSGHPTMGTGNRRSNWSCYSQCYCLPARCVCSTPKSGRQQSLA